MIAASHFIGCLLLHTGLFGGILAGERFQDMLGNREYLHRYWISPLLLTETPADSTMTGLVTAIYDIGCAFGAVTAFVFGEQIGRKRSIILANIIGTFPRSQSQAAS